ncbi:hypothetical protein X271_00138 [Candidatus Hepatoplasma crinochetorum Av]|uniref:DUF2130 domain-containing protein n=1 Tax=Candidatus Hepatoplasma crinochetorum Av TaxID=1427984 RepID=W8GJ26_9MOLU|nr:DUF2130 domain-containing protein [Candidatus Hepatoplasma crinochetorum]AHK22247.1 hypothetical protein X271_00138 [Candidatus Hepatoplasma crinochetorum Av]
MNKELKIKLIDENNLNFSLKEKGEIGDIINLNSLNNIDFSSLQNNINLLKDQFIKDKITQELNYERKELNLKYQSKILDLEKEKDQTINNLEKEINNLQFNFKAEVNKKVWEIEDDLKKKKDQFEIFVREETKIKQEKDFQKLLNKDQEISKLNSILQNYQEKEQFRIDQIILEKDQKIYDLKNTKNKLIENLKNQNEELSIEIDNLKRNRSQNIKLLGSELEGWIDQELQENFAWNERINIIKEPKVINKQKADFVIEIKNGLKVTKIVIEAKTELFTGDNKKTNKSHLEKLENYRKRSESEYAILVSELENEKDFLVYKDSNYKHIFIVRPKVLISLLQFMINLLIVNQKILDLNVEFNDKQTILKEWDLFLKDVDKTFSTLKTNLEIILDEKDKLITIANKIGERANIVLNTQIITLDKKLKKFNIEKKITNKINNLNLIENLNSNFKNNKEEQDKEIAIL